MQINISEGFSLDVKNALIHSVCASGTEFIDPHTPFGHFSLRADGCAYDTDGAEPVSTMEDDSAQRATFLFGALEAVRGFSRLSDGALRYEITLTNCGQAPVTVDELSIRFAMNSQFDWGVKGAERVIRHSFVSADGSFLYFTPCDGHPPYLVLLPEDGTGLEMFDTHALRHPDPDKKDGKERLNVYRAMIHAAYEEGVAREKGCDWRIPVTKRILAPGESASYAFSFRAAAGYQAVRDLIYQNGQPDVEIIPGMTLPRGTEALLRIRSQKEITIKSEYPADTCIRAVSAQGDAHLYAAVFTRLGENRLILRWDDNRQSILEFFITLPIEALMKKRGQFIAEHQHKGTGKWYEGLLAEHNNETGALLGPDNYDLIKGWRIYEVTCDDPGMSKPAFLSGVNAELPDQKQIEALEYYVEHFVWGGLQRTDKEEYPYGIYGIPDWKTLRDKTDDIGVTGIAHLWRIYDYPHLALMYMNLYRIGAQYPHIRLKVSPLEYLNRAYRTLLAQYTYPMELDEWSPYKTGTYNELVVTDIISALRKEGRPLAAQRLECHWLQKAKFFITACQDVFGSEYPFDTTGYESTQALACTGLDYAKAWQPKHQHDKRPYTPEQAREFMDYQAKCNLACRGIMENAYHLLGSDYRNCSAHYTLSYMAQMGGQALMAYALYYAEDPFDILRVAYASMLSSWALMNAGDEEGYWFPGKEHNGAAGGGFENAPYGQTWLEQPHHRGSWYYSCEIDLGYCGYLRGAATVLCADPRFGTVCYGGVLAEGTVHLQDGVNRRFHHITQDRRVHLIAHNARFESVSPKEDGSYLVKLSYLGQDGEISVQRGDENTVVPIAGRTCLSV